jgi:hypothetical protein
LIQGEENDVVVSRLKIPSTSFEATCNDSNDCSIKVGSINVILNENNGNILCDVVPHIYVRWWQIQGGPLEHDCCPQEEID